MLRSGGLAGLDRAHDADDFRHRPDVMDTDDRRAVCDAPGDGGGGGEEAVAGVGFAGDFGEEALAAGAEDEGVPQLGELAEASEELEVVVDAFAEADAGVEEDPVGGDAGGAGGGGAVAEAGLD